MSHKLSLSHTSSLHSSKTTSLQVLKPLFKCCNLFSSPSTFRYIMQLVLEYCKLFHTIPIKGRRQKLFSGFFRLGGTPPTPLAENHFAKKPSAEMGVPPPLTESPLSFSGKNCSSQPSMVQWLSSSIFPCSVVCCPSVPLW